MAVIFSHLHATLYATLYASVTVGWFVGNASTFRCYPDGFCPCPIARDCIRCCREILAPVPRSTLGRMTRKSTRSRRRALGHLLRSACFAPAVPLARLLARSLTHSEAHGKEVFVYGMSLSISFNFNPLSAHVYISFSVRIRAVKLADYLVFQGGGVPQRVSAHA